MPATARAFSGHRRKSKGRRRRSRFEQRRRRFFIVARIVAVEGRHRIEAAGVRQLAQVGFLLLFREGEHVVDAHHIDIAVDVFPDIAIEQAGKVVFVVTEHRGERFQRDRLRIMLVDIIERGDDGRHVRRGDHGRAPVMGKQFAEDDVDVSLRHQHGCQRFLVFQFEEEGQQRAVESLVRQQGRQRLLFQQGRKVVFVLRLDDQHIVLIGGGGGQLVHGAPPREDDVVLFRIKTLAVHHAEHPPLGDVQHLDAAVEVRKRDPVFAPEKAHGLFLVVYGFVKSGLFHRSQFLI